VCLFTVSRRKIGLITDLASLVAAQTLVSILAAWPKKAYCECEKEEDPIGRALTVIKVLKQIMKGWSYYEVHRVKS
jgi:hypothetical protein